jgi:hypothetical protein
MPREEQHKVPDATLMKKQQNSARLFLDCEFQFMTRTMRFGIGNGRPCALQSQESPKSMSAILFHAVELLEHGSMN